MGHREPAVEDPPRESIPRLANSIGALWGGQVLPGFSRNKSSDWAVPGRAIHFALRDYGKHRCLDRAMARSSKTRDSGPPAHNQVETGSSIDQKEMAANNACA